MPKNFWRQTFNLNEGKQRALITIPNRLRGLVDSPLGYYIDSLRMSQDLDDLLLLQSRKSGISKFLFTHKL